MNEKTVTLPDDDWVVIDQALQRMPYGQVAGIYQRINEQFAAQRQPPEPSKEEDLHQMAATQSPSAD